MTEKPKVNSAAEKELIKVEEQFKEFDSQVKEMTQDRMNMAPKLELEPQTKIANRDLDKMKDIYLKPKKSIGSREKFNELYREQYNHSKEYVQFIAENKEIIGENIDLWTKPFAGMPAEEWDVPTNKPVWAPRYVAEQISRKFYHRLTMKENSIGSDGMGSYYGTMAVDNTIARLDAKPVSSRRSVFMGGSNF
jgi:hypothetical protein